MTGTADSKLWIPVTAMAFVVVLSNILVHFPIGDWLTLGAFTFPLAFLVTDLSNRTWGPKLAARVVFIGFVVGILMSALFSDWGEGSAFRGEPNVFSQLAILTAVASGSAFISGQLLDIAIFQRLRHGAWWRAPVVSSAIASAVDTAIFFYLLFGVFFPEWSLTWWKFGLADYAVKAAMALCLLFPYRLLLGRFAPNLLAAGNGGR